MTGNFFPLTFLTFKLRKSAFSFPNVFLLCLFLSHLKNQSKVTSGDWDTKIKTKNKKYERVARVSRAYCFFPIAGQMLDEIYSRVVVRAR